MTGNRFHSKQNISLRGTQWEKPKNNTVARAVREMATETGVRYEATLFGQTVQVKRAGKAWRVVN